LATTVLCATLVGAEAGVGSGGLSWASATLAGACCETSGTDAQTTGVCTRVSNSTRGGPTQSEAIRTNGAWPAQLESMLRAKGSSTLITNAGVFGDTTGQVLPRLSSAVPNGTKVVILDICAFNDVRTGGSADVARANIITIKSQLAGRGIR